MVLAALITLLAAQAVGNLPPEDLPAKPPSPGLEQIFIAPSGEEFRAPSGAPYPVADWFARADADHDGKLTEGEFTADVMQYFARLDLNHDGTIDGRELQAYEDAMASELHTGNFGGYGPTGGGRDDDVYMPGSDIRISRRSGSWLDQARGAGRFDLLRIPQPIAAMDVGLNGRISRQEAEDAAAYRFSMLDMKKQGYLLFADLPETFAQGHRIDDRRRGRRNGRRPR